MDFESRNLYSCKMVAIHFLRYDRNENLEEIGLSHIFFFFFFFELIVFTFFNDLAFQKNTTFVDAYYILVNHSLISPENGFYKPLSFKLLTLKSLLTPLPISSCKSVKLMRPPLKCYEKLHNIR